MEPPAFRGGWHAGWRCWWGWLRRRCCWCAAGEGTWAFAVPLVPLVPLVSLVPLVPLVPLVSLVPLVPPMVSGR